MKLAVIAAAGVGIALIGAGSVHGQGTGILQEWIDYAEYLKSHYEERIRGLEGRVADLEAENTLLKSELSETVADGNPVIRGLIDGEIKYYVEPLPAYSTYDIALFDDYLDGRIQEGVPLKRVYDEASADFSVRWVKDYGDHLGVAYGRTTATVGLGGSNCGEWQHFDDASVTATAWHEIGHVLGFGHSDDPGNIMYPTGHTRYKQDIHFEGPISDGWYHSVEFCNGGRQYFSVETGDRNEGVSVFVVTPDTDPKEFIADDIGMSYPACGGTTETWYKYYEECEIDDGAKLVIHNTGDNTAMVEYRIVDMNDHPEIEMRWDPAAYEYSEAYLDYIDYLQRSHLVLAGDDPDGAAPEDCSEIYHRIYDEMSGERLEVDEYLYYAPLCYGQVSYDLSSGRLFDKFDVYVLPPGTDVAGFMDGGRGEYYECDGYDRSHSSLSGACNVESGSSLIIYNVMDHPIRVTGTVYE